MFKIIRDCIVSILIGVALLFALPMAVYFIDCQIGKMEDSITEGLAQECVESKDELVEDVSILLEEYYSDREDS